MYPEITFRRWAERNGKTVKWGNVIGPYCGQEFTETFTTEKEAKERERQALALEAIGDEKKPIALCRKEEGR